MPDVDLDALGAQYREARDAIAVHRRRQAEAEVAMGRTAKAIIRQYGYLEETTELIAARAVVDQAVADVEWCKAAAIAAAEQYKGVSFAEALERNDANRAEARAAHQRNKAEAMGGAG